MTEPRVKWTATIDPGKPFATRVEEVSTEDAIRENPRREGEELEDWLTRVNVAAQEILAGRAVVTRMPYLDRELAELNSEVMSEFISRCVKEGNLLGIRFPAPGEVA